MTKDDITKWARESGGLPDPMVFIGAYERFAALVAAAQREADAKLIEEYPYWLGTVAKKEIAAAIRGTT